MFYTTTKGAPDCRVAPRKPNSLVPAVLTPSPQGQEVYLALSVLKEQISVSIKPKPRLHCGPLGRGPVWSRAQSY